MKFTAPPSMYDVLPFAPPKDTWLQTAIWRRLEAEFRAVCRQYGFREIRTPILESEELFIRSVGDHTDIVSKEMFALTDRGGRTLALKPEGTAPTVRACVQHGLLGEHPTLKVYYLGQHFRQERGQRGRYRQHQQMGVEVFGPADASIEAEVILLASNFYRRLGVTDQELHINTLGTDASRAGYLEALREYVRPHLADLSEEGRARWEQNPLRMLDTKSESDLRILEEAPRLADYADAATRAQFERLQQYLTDLGVPFVVDHRLVRGFDYYTGLTFEISSPHLGAQSALGGGGRYDRLAGECGGPPTPAVGFGLGVERCLIALEALGRLPEPEDERMFAWVAPLDDSEPVMRCAVGALHAIRGADLPADMDYRSRKLSKQLERADRAGARFIVIIGETEAAEGSAVVQEQATKARITVTLGDLAPYLLKQAEAANQAGK